MLASGFAPILVVFAPVANISIIYERYMNKDISETLLADTDGLKTYEYLANNLDSLSDEEIAWLVDNMARVDLSGQFLASGARYLNALDAERYAEPVRRMVALTIDLDREHRYIGDLIESIYGADYVERADELSRDDNNFRRMYKRLYPDGAF